PLDELADVCRAQDAWLMVDDAHGFGVLGAHGEGSVAQFSAKAQPQVLVGTLGKAFGTAGAFVAGSEDLIETLIQFARTYIYTTALPPAVAAATLASLELVRGGSERREHLQSLVQHFRRGATDLGYQLMPSATPIQPLLIGADAEALALSNALRADGLLVSAIRPPTVPEGSARLRITLTAAHQSSDVDALLQSLARHASNGN
ncbi:MAG: aminotransferase class I/II-fold pyridoxal phosphate-dependent enzyme, partial [Alcanivoracaceae bacterium]|nr:aminotransferase class I/II-fold pyridoxal phosphate-dependent enzyme [Alcanivoracaceae bacterium]